MRQIHHGSDEPAAELAFDEAMLLQADAVGGGELLRLWEFTSPVVVIGRSSKFENEVNHTFCEQHRIPVLRRCSGGASIVAGPGCLMYSVVLSFDRHPELQKIDVAHRFVMQRLLCAVRAQLATVQMQGICDLTLDERKFSGNSLRIARRNLLYHGTILYDADLDLIAECLATPPRQPDYRRQRSHSEFITNLSVDPERLRSDIAKVFSDSEQSQSLTTITIPELEQVQALARELTLARYSDPSWHRRH